MRLIDADALKEKRFKMYSGFLGDVSVVAVKDIDNAPTIDPSTLRPKGEWILEAHNDRVNYGWNVTVKCPNCGKEAKRILVGFFLGFTDEQVIEIALQRAAVKLDNFCPNCGADMRPKEAVT